MKYASILHSRTGERRRYTAPYDFHGLIQRVYDRIKFWHPQAVEGAPPTQLGNQVVASDFWVRGEGGHHGLALTLGLELPLDFLDFNKHFQNYALVSRNVIELMDSGEVEDITVGLREGEDIPRDSPHRIYRFAQIAGESSHFMFRWNKDGTFRDVAFARYTDSSEYDILGESADLFSCDKDFTSWLTRMVETDGAPLHLLLSDELDFQVTRV